MTAGIDINSTLVLSADQESNKPAAKIFGSKKHAERFNIAQSNFVFDTLANKYNDIITNNTDSLFYN